MENTSDKADLPKGSLCKFNYAFLSSFTIVREDSITVDADT